MSDLAKYFSFGAYNTGRFPATFLQVRALDPKLTKPVKDGPSDRDMLLSVFAEPAIAELMSTRCLRFGLPQTLEIAEGRERAIVPPINPDDSSEPQTFPVPLRHLGALDTETAISLVLPHLHDNATFDKAFRDDKSARVKLEVQGFQKVNKDKPLELNLVFGEMRQMILRVEVPDRTTATVIRVEHDAKPPEGSRISIGSFNVLFVPRYDPFAGCS